MCTVVLPLRWRVCNVCFRPAAAATVAATAGSSGGASALARPLTEADGAALVKALEAAADNAARLALLKERCAAKTFSVQQILRLLSTTPSVKTQLAMVGLLAPKCSDPGAAQPVVDNFR
jgi:hypothetical protein